MFDSTDFASLINDLDDLVCYRDLEGALVIWNKAFAESIRVSFGREPYVGMKTVDYLSPEQRENFKHHRELFQEVLKGNRRSAEFSYKIPSGKTEHFEITWSPSIKEEKVTGAIEFIRNITQRKEVELILQQTEEKFRSIVENANEAVFVSQGGKIKYFNPRAIEWTGYSANDLYSTPFINYIHPEDRERVMLEYGERISGDKNSSNYKIRIITKSGDMKWVFINSSQINWAGSPAVLTMVSDISGLKKAEEKLRERDERYRAFVKNSSEGIWCIELKKTVSVELPVDEQIDMIFRYAFLSEVNDFYVRSLGYEKGEELVGHPITDVMPRLMPESHATLRLFINSDYNVIDLESSEVAKDGEQRVYLNNIVGVVEDGYLLRAWGTQRDVTEQKLAEKDLSRLAGRLISVQEEERRRLARELHDDLTQRLAILAIDTGKLKQEEACASKAAIVLDSIQNRLVAISEDVHAISRQLHPSIIEDLGLTDALNAECDAFSRRESISVDFEHDRIPENIPHDIAICLFRIAQEGLRNAGKYSQAEIIDIRLSLENGDIMLIVRDNGAGFDPKEIRKQPGLGLASMRERIKLVGGSLKINSQPGQGCEVVAMVEYNQVV